MPGEVVDLLPLDVLTLKQCAFLEVQNSCSSKYGDEWIKLNSRDKQ